MALQAITAALAATNTITRRLYVFNLQMPSQEGITPITTITGITAFISYITMHKKEYAALAATNTFILSDHHIITMF